MSDNFLSAEKPKSETDSGWIEYALLLGWEELPVGYEYVTDNATDELATLRAQLAEAREIIEPFAAEAGMWGSKTSDDETPIIKGSDGKGDEAAFTVGDLRKAQKWYDKVITA